MGTVCRYESKRVSGFVLFGTSLALAEIWLLSSLSVSDGPLMFLICGLVWLGLIFLVIRGRAKPAFVVSLTLLMLSFGVVCLETLLRLAPGILQGQTANAAYSGYHTNAGGIYRRDPRLGNALRPSQHVQLYWNGHWWNHATNATGFRGPMVDRAEAVFLGDSMIYGHGVDNDQTVASYYASRTGQSAANLGQQGTCAPQALELYRRHGMVLKPRWVFLCCHPNDIAESTAWYSPDDLENFVSSPLDTDFDLLARPKFQPRPHATLKELWNAHLALPLRSAGVIKTLAKYLHNRKTQGMDGNLDVVDRKRFVPSEGSLQDQVMPGREGASAEEELQWRAHRHGIAKLKHLCQANGALLVIFDIGYPFTYSHSIEAMAQELGIPYSTAGRVVLEQVLAGQDLYLANDGHWSAAGCQAIAAELHNFVRYQTQDDTRSGSELSARP